jgi:hypothetical protein
MVPPTICALAPGAIKIRIERRQFGSASRKLCINETPGDFFRKRRETTSGNNKNRRSAARGKRVVQTCVAGESSSMRISLVKLVNRRKYC